jgi:16S rRNA (cytosine967-C5)-methyltransferase
VSRYHSYLNSAKEILSLYKGREPFASFIKKYFAANKKFGSKDRREVSNLCYSFFRLGNAAKNLPLDERILAGKFLCSSEPDELLQELKPEWNDKTQLSVKEKLEMFGAEWKDVFPWQNELSDGMGLEKFAESFFIQPDMFLRIRPGYAENVLLLLDNAGVNYEFISPFSIRLPNSFKADKYFEPDKEIVVQDYNSQLIAGFIPVRRRPSDSGSDQRPGLWDCCAGSGGKSILAKDILGDIDLTVSDVRESILTNLKKRFERARIKKYKSFVADLTRLSPDSYRDATHHSPFDFIIADVPCSGSGTWGRTPEQTVFFNTTKIDEYAALQKKIVSNIISYLKPGGHLLYITCSVFKKENEEAVEYIKKQFHLQLVKMELLKGYSMKADTMFAALLHKPL